MWSNTTSVAVCEHASEKAMQGNYDPDEAMQRDYDPDEAMQRDYDPDEVAIEHDVSELKARLRPLVDAALYDAAQKIVLSAGDKLRLRKDWCLTENVKCNIQKAIRSQVHDGLRLMPTADGVHLPYQEKLSESLIARIDSGQLNLIEYCNSSCNSKNVPWDYVTSGILSECNLPACVLHPLDVRKFNARINNDIVYNMRGHDARYINFYDLWNAVSPWDNQEPGHVRFSLPTAIMVLRLSGMKHAPDLEDFLHFDHPDNNISCDVENRPNSSGHAFVIAKKLAEAWNAMVLRKHRQPPRGSAAHKRMKEDFYTIEDVQQTMATLSRLINKQPTVFKAQGELFFALRKSKSKIPHVDAERLFQPAITLTNNDQIVESQRLFAAYERGEWTETGITFSDPISCPRSSSNHPIEPLYLRLADASTFNWDVAKNTFIAERVSHQRPQSTPRWQRVPPGRRSKR
jgi:hypothetical protein